MFSDTDFLYTVFSSAEWFLYTVFTDTDFLYIVFSSIEWFLYTVFSDTDWFPSCPTDRLVHNEVTEIVRTHPDISEHNCKTKCDALFDLVIHTDERLTDHLCNVECIR